MSVLKRGFGSICSDLEICSCLLRVKNVGRMIVVNYMVLFVPMRGAIKVERCLISLVIRESYFLEHAWHGAGKAHVVIGQELIT